MDIKCQKCTTVAVTSLLTTLKSLQSVPDAEASRDDKTSCAAQKYYTRKNHEMVIVGLGFVTNDSTTNWDTNKITEGNDEVHRRVTSSKLLCLRNLAAAHR